MTRGDGWVLFGAALAILHGWAIQAEALPGAYCTIAGPASRSYVVGAVMLASGLTTWASSARRRGLS